MTYRDELAAALARIADLDRQLDDARTRLEEAAARAKKPQPERVAALESELASARREIEGLRAQVGQALDPGGGAESPRLRPPPRRVPFFLGTLQWCTGRALAFAWLGFLAAPAVMQLAPWRATVAALCALVVWAPILRSGARRWTLLHRGVESEALVVERQDGFLTWERLAIQLEVRGEILRRVMRVPHEMAIGKRPSVLWDPLRPRRFLVFPAQFPPFEASGPHVDARGELRWPPGPLGPAFYFFVYVLWLALAAVAWTALLVHALG